MVYQQPIKPTSIMELEKTPPLNLSGAMTKVGQTTMYSLSSKDLLDLMKTQVIQLKSYNKK